MQLNPYLSFDGQCEAAFKFYEQCLKGKITALMPYEGSPMAEEVPEEWLGKVMHGEVRLGDRILMGSDCTPEAYEKPQGVSLMLGFDQPAEAERTFNALAEKGTVKMPLEETFWAVRFGMVTDQFGISWMVNCDKPTP
ncbi:MAG: VOC family protein [Synechococcales cyanobacterium RU_4_20]|nr:VOC family protein [Synechococcales cyanobacterium RU_4_20]NJR70250.1 VOC family protein [Synechococcales cyanobacterium CRU_2_2]